jgi:hypothetical protein
VTYLSGDGIAGEHPQETCIHDPIPTPQTSWLDRQPEQSTEAEVPEDLGACSFYPAM